MHHRGFLEHYNRELRHIREMAGEFAAEYPKIAARLSLDRDAQQVCPDPFVERLLEGFAFLTARVQTKMDAEFPSFTQGMLETIYPHYLAPTPSMAVVKMQPDYNDSALLDGLTIPAKSYLVGNKAKEERTACTFRTAHAVTLHAFDIAEAEYHVRNLADLRIAEAFPKARAALRIRLATQGAAPGFEKIRCSSLPFFLRGEDSLPVTILEQIFTHALGVIVRAPADFKQIHRTILPVEALRHMGFAEEEALLPPSPRSFEGYRMLREHFALPQRNLFFEVELGQAFAKLASREVDLIIPLKERREDLPDFVRRECLDLFCTPVVNLFEKRTDRVPIQRFQSEYHVIVDRTRTLDYEIHGIDEVIGYGLHTGETQKFHPFYLSQDTSRESPAFYTLSRVRRTASARERKFGALSSYAGGEVYLSLVDPNCAPFSPGLEQLGIKALCTNRHLPITMAVGVGESDFTLENSAPVVSIRCLTRPTTPKPSFAEGDFAWRLVSHLSLNYLSLLDDTAEGASALREMLRLYADDDSSRLEVDGLRSAKSRPILRRSPGGGPVTFLRGLEITLSLDEKKFEGTGMFLFASVLEQFLARYVSINSFTETVVRTEQRGEVIRWPARIGKIHTL